MLDRIKQKQVKKARRRARVRARVFGTAEKPRLSVRRSLRGMYIQLIDDENSKTLASVNSKKDAGGNGDVGERQGKLAISYILGKNLANKAQEAGITKAVFDRAGNKYHGRIKAVAEGARDGGLEF